MDLIPRRHAFPVLNDQFFVDESYEFTKELGQGAYGVVCAAKNKKTGESVAIKKVTKIFTKKILTKRALRELKLLHHFRGHKNITCLYDMDITDPTNFTEVYLYEELMEADLHAIIRSGQPLSDAHFQSFIYQTLCGLKYIHSASVLHRDLKPGNLLVNADCELKICDFGLARGFETDPALAQANNQGFMTEYVATRWYRAPEIMLSFQNYTTAIDLWSVGCILAELLGGRPIFKGRDYVDQLNQILHYLGTPSEETLRRVGSPRAQDYIRSLPRQAGIPFVQLYPNANPLALDLLSKLLAFDPSERITCNEALKHPYLSLWHDPVDEIDCREKFNFGFESEETTEGMKQMIVDEVMSFRRLVRPHLDQQQTLKPGGPNSESHTKKDVLPIPSREVVMSSPTKEDGGNSFNKNESSVNEGADKVQASDENPAENLESELAAKGLENSN
ncbi:kinase-like domain-containing protein [Phakopsora pachyrhizi]|uniref:Mitogen-activated protein kinase n=1 Tax=Phakopsora pachyrhizi TaxID=170000 RepID=A0AAV0AGN6_PHAPC|nr:kinase-like domain-containing protein [Phakopsora pachyrhizi]CAH7666880.1 kinase-like domain-containing protein [Phakopsora pachyrhizi]